MGSSSANTLEGYLDSRRGATRKDALIYLGSIAGAIILVFCAGLLVRPINKVRKESQLVLDASEVEGLPAEIVLLTKLGTLRGLALDAAFIRLEEYKQEHRWFELMQLSDWVCKLAPRYPSVWGYSAWNMAYNISVSQYSPEARWRWVSNGIENIRNQGLLYNPKEITLYKELAWIIWHKVGDRLDDYHMMYKREMAVEMELVLGEPPLALSQEEIIDNFRKIAEAPRDLEAFIADNPKVSELVDKLKNAGLAIAADPRRPAQVEGDPLLRFVAIHMRERDRQKLSAEQEQANADGDPTSVAARRAILNDPQYADAVDELLAAVRSHVIRDPHIFNMEVDWMLELMERYGPVDWRSPYAQSLYWGTYGDMVTRGNLIIEENDSMNAVRFIFFSLQNLSRAGDLILEPDFEQPNRSFLEMLPDTRFIMPLHEAYLKYGKEQFGDDPRFVEGTSGPNYFTGHKNFLAAGISQFYFKGDEESIEKAKDLYFYLREYDITPDGHMKPRYNMTLEQFVLAGLWEAADAAVNAKAIISQILDSSLVDLSSGDVKASVARYRSAEKIWKYAMRDTKDERSDRRKLEPLPRIRRDAALNFMRSPENSILQKSRLWKKLDLLTRKSIYNDALPFIEQHCEATDTVVEKVMPEPPGMAEYDESVVDEALKRFDPTVSEGERSE